MSCIISRHLRVCIASKGWEVGVHMRFAYAMLTSSGEPLEFFIMREVGVHHYKPYEVALEGSIIML
jgi:hypothetical protein